MQNDHNKAIAIALNTKNINFSDGLKDRTIVVYEYINIHCINIYKNTRHYSNLVANN